MLLRKAILLLSIVFLVGCQAKKLPLSSTSVVTPTLAGASGVDVYAAKRQNGEAVPTYRGDQFVEVRSYAKQSVKNSSRKKNVEFGGARCALSGSGFEGNITTPAKIRVPIYGHESSELAVRCAADGYRPTVRTVRAFNKTKSDRLKGSGSGGVLGVVLVAAINAASDEKKHVFLYPEVAVLLEQ